MLPEHAVLLGAQRLDRALRLEIEVVGAQADDPTAERIERVAEQQPLADRVDAAALPALAVPRVADLDAVDGLHDVVVARAADDGAARQLAHRPRQHVAAVLARERVGDVDLHLLGLRHRREPELPELSVRCRCGQRVAVRRGERLEPDAMALERHGSRLLHGRFPRASRSWRVSIQTSRRNARSS